MTNKVVTITLNPALDLTGTLPQLNTGSVSVVSSSALHAAGKGVNVAKVLSDLGASVTVTGFLGTDNQELFCQLFEQIGANDQFIRVEGATRINVKLVEQNSRVSDINFPGIVIPEQAIAEFEETLDVLCEDHEYFVLAGSLPRGVSEQQCQRWIELLNARGKKVLFDSSRHALASGIQSKPWLIKPNDEELAELTGQSQETEAECIDSAALLRQQGIANVVVSRGEKGVVWLNNSGAYLAQPPKMEVVSTVGAGDTLVAGLCWGHMQDMPATQLIQFATALSALAVGQVGVGVQDINQLNTLQNLIKVEHLSLAEHTGTEG
ncbi:1-phosphofructokinase [Vibrio sp.]|uniref:1-phosphofructokinase n=1 Tax=Vibrio sp. TaxID=678 RepID=UPI003D14A4D0